MVVEFRFALVAYGKISGNMIGKESGHDDLRLLAAVDFIFSVYGEVYPGGKVRGQRLGIAVFDGIRNQIALRFLGLKGGSAKEKNKQRRKNFGHSSEVS